MNTKKEAGITMSSNIDMSWRRDTRQQRGDKERLDREINGLMVSLQEEQARAKTVHKKIEFLDKLKKALQGWIPQE